MAPLPPAERTNRSAIGLETMTLPDGRLRVTTRVAAWGGASEDVGVELRSGEAGTRMRLAGRSRLSPKGGASVERRFELAAPVGDGYVVVQSTLEQDLLAEDDVRHGVHHVERRPRILVVDDDRLIREMVADSLEGIDVVFAVANDLADHLLAKQALKQQTHFLSRLGFVAFEDIEAYNKFLDEFIFKLPGVSQVRSNIVLKEIKADTALPFR